MKSSINAANLPNTPTWEKVLGFCGFLLLTAGIGYLTWMAITEDDSPPEMRLVIRDVHTLDRGYLVQLEVTNTSSQSVADLQIEGWHRLDGNTEVSRAQLDYVPSRSKSYAGLFFSRNPESGELQMKSLGYQKP